MPKQNLTSPIFLVGVYRSGTTLLRMMLNSHSRIAIPVETHFLEDVIYRYEPTNELEPSQLDDVFSRMSRHERFRHFETSPEKFQLALQSGDSWTLKSVIEKFFELETKQTGKPRWADKTPSYVEHVSRLATVFPDAKFIHICRDGRDVSNSLRERSWQGATEFQRASYWQRCVSKASRDGGRLGPERFLQLQYESLVRKPEDNLRNICEFLGEAYEPGMLEYQSDAGDNVVKKSIHSKLTRLPDPDRDIGRWANESSSRRVFAFEVAAGRGLDSMGYARKYSKVLTWLASLVYVPMGWLVAKAHRAYLSTPDSWRSGLRQSGIVRRVRALAYGNKSKGHPKNASIAVSSPMNSSGEKS